MKALLSFRITTDHDDRLTPVRVTIKLFREEEGYVWRLDSERGDECEALPRPELLARAKADVRAVYPRQSPFQPKARWL